MLIPEGTKFVTPDGFEICVLCLEKTEPPVAFHTPVDQRIGYIDMCGQTCANTKLCQERQEGNRRRNKRSNNES